MFKKFEEKEAVTGVQQLKSSIQKGIRNKLVEDYPYLEGYIDQIIPKKENFRLVKCKEHLEILAGSKGEILFFKSRDGPFIPTLRLLHKYPFILLWQQLTDSRPSVSHRRGLDKVLQQLIIDCRFYFYVDKGAIRFVLSGAQIMCPGLTSPGAKLSPDAKSGTVVAIMAEGKQHALAIGQMKLSSEEILKVNKGVGVENIHYLNDGLWKMQPIK